MKRRLTLPCLLTLLAAGYSTDAALVSVNIRQFDNAANNIDAAESYGVAAESSVTDGWMNVGGPAVASLKLADGTPTTVSTTGNNPGGTQTVFSGTLDNTPMRAGMATYSPTAGSFPTLDFTGLAATFSSYDLIVYLTGNDGADSAQISDGTTTYYFSPVGGAGTPGAVLTESTDTNSGDGIDEANYVVFRGLTSDTLSVQVKALDTNAGNGGTFVGIGGFQISGTLVPEPGSLALLGLGGLLIARRRR